MGHCLTKRCGELQSWNERINVTRVWSERENEVNAQNLNVWAWFMQIKGRRKSSMRALNVYSWTLKPWQKDQWLKPSD